jgi:hypothetical protein
LHNALCSGDLVAEGANGRDVPINVWREWTSTRFLDCVSAGETVWGWTDGIGDWTNPCLRTVDIELWLAKAASEAAALDHWLSEDAQPVENRQHAESTVETATLIVPDYCEPGGRAPSFTDPLPVYLQFLVELVPQLGGRDRIGSRKKTDIEAEIEARWRPELGQRSQNLAGAMATILRPPEAQRGGAKPMRAVGNGASREGWNGSTPASEAEAEVEPVGWNRLTLRVEPFNP